LDPAADRGNRLKQVAVIDAWESAKQRVERERQEDAEARSDARRRRAADDPRRAQGWRAGRRRLGGALSAWPPKS
jgi:hypothetical protein